MTARQAILLVSFMIELAGCADRSHPPNTREPVVTTGPIRVTSTRTITNHPASPEPPATLTPSPASPEPSATASPMTEVAPTRAAADQGILFVVTYSGGLCVYGGCQVDITLSQDGQYVIRDGSGKTQRKQVESASVIAVREALDQADFTTVTVPVTPSICASAYDGQDVSYTFYPQSGSVSIPCNAQYGESVRRLIMSVQAVLEMYGRQP